MTQRFPQVKAKIESGNRVGGGGELSNTYFQELYLSLAC